VIRHIVRFALTNPLFVALGTVLFIGGGLIAFGNLPVEAFPDVTDTQVTVITLYPGRAAEEVERQVTIPLEIALAGLPYAIRMFSHTQFGLSYIVITFDDRASLFFSRQVVDGRLRALDLPPGVEPELGPPASATGEVFRYRLESATVPPVELRALQDWVVSRQIRQVPGIADVVSLGGPVKQYEVHPDLQKLRDYKLTLGQLFGAIERANANAGGGGVTQGRQQFLIRSLGALRSSADIGQIVVEEVKGTPVLVRDVADVVQGRAPVQGVIGTGTNEDVVSGIVLMRAGENPSKVLGALKAKIAQINKGALPAGVKLVPYYDRSWLIGKTLHTVFGNLLEGALLVMLVLYVFLGNLRAAGIVALLIPLALLGTFIGLTLLGIPANLLSLGAMDLGIIVDGAVIVVENIFRRLAEPRDHARGPMNVVLEATTEVGRPTVFSIVIIIVAHVPIFTMQRHEGKIFAPMAWSVTSALVAALVFSLTLVPLLAYLLLRKNVPHEENRLMKACLRGYQPLLRWAVERPRIILAGAAGALAVALAVAPHLGTEFLPELDEGSIWVNVTLPPSVSPDEARKEMRRLRDLIDDFPEVNFAVSKAGRPDDGTDPKNINQAEILVDLKPRDQWRKGMTKDKLVAQMDELMSRTPGLDPSFSMPVRDQILESISQIDGQVVVKLFGDDIALLRERAGEVLARIAPVPGVARAFIDREGSLPQFAIEIDRAAAARYGINIGDIQDVVETALAGKAATELWEGERHFSVVVRLGEGERVYANLPNVLVSAPSGTTVPLAALAQLRPISGAMNISRENGRRVVSIGVFIRGRDMGSVVADMQRATRDVALPPGYDMTWSGEFENQERAMRRLAVVVPLSILMIFVLLFDAFKSFGQAGLIIANIPFALIGGVLILFASGIPLSVSAAIGFIALFGQAVLNGVVMVTYFNQLRLRGMSAYEAVVTGSLTRLRTVLMTALLAMFGLLPMALSTGIGSETQKPLALVVIGGLITATFLTLVVLPTMYLWSERWQEGRAARRARGQSAGTGSTADNPVMAQRSDLD
jgi:cobalt-zinc-cadmium resistance protein CzcA